MNTLHNQPHFCPIQGFLKAKAIGRSNSSFFFFLKCIGSTCLGFEKYALTLLFVNEEKYRIHFFRTCSSSFSALIPPEQLADPSQLLFFCINLARATGGSALMVGMGAEPHA